MIEFISLCVCSACLSCLCCLVTGGLCIIPATVRLRNKIVEKSLPEGMQWFGKSPPTEVCESDSSSVSDFSSTSRDYPKDERPIGCIKRSKEVPRHRSKECQCVDETGSSGREKKNKRSKSRDNSRRKGWTFCFKLGKPTGDSSEYGEPLEEKEKATPTETVEPKSSSGKKSKKSQTRKHSSKIYCAYFKSCSCTNVREPAKKWRRKKYRSTKCPLESNRDKRRPKAFRKSRKCPKNCQCKIVFQEETPAPERERETEICCKCGARNTRR